MLLTELECRTYASNYGHDIALVDLADFPKGCFRETIGQAFIQVYYYNSHASGSACYTVDFCVCGVSPPSSPPPPLSPSPSFPPLLPCTFTTCTGFNSQSDAEAHCAAQPADHQCIVSDSDLTAGSRRRLSERVFSFLDNSDGHATCEAAGLVSVSEADCPTAAAALGETWAGARNEAWAAPSGCVRLTAGFTTFFTGPNAQDCTSTYAADSACICEDVPSSSHYACICLQAPPSTPPPSTPPPSAPPPPPPPPPPLQCHVSELVCMDHGSDEAAAIAACAAHPGNSTCFVNSTLTTVTPAPCSNTQLVGQGGSGLTAFANEATCAAAGSGLYAPTQAQCSGTGMATLDGQPMPGWFGLAPANSAYAPYMNTCSFLNAMGSVWYGYNEGYTVNKPCNDINSVLIGCVCCDDRPQIAYKYESCTCPSSPPPLSPPPSPPPATCLARDVEVTVSSGMYHLNGVPLTAPYSIGLGNYYFRNIPASHPASFLQGSNGATQWENAEGNNNPVQYKNVNAYRYGDVLLYVDHDPVGGSLDCYYHGDMSQGPLGLGAFVFDSSCPAESPASPPSFPPPRFPGGGFTSLTNSSPSYTYDNSDSYEYEQPSIFNTTAYNLEDEIDHPLCDPGDSLVALDGSFRCTQTQKLPNPLNDGASLASGATPSRRECGTWMDADPSPLSVKYRSFKDIGTLSGVSRSHIRAKVTSATDPSNVARAFRSCLKTISGADMPRKHARNAYETLLRHALRPRIDDNRINMSAAALAHGFGFIGSLSCGGGPVISVSDGGNHVAGFVYPTNLLQATDARDALLLVNESSEEADRAYAAVGSMQGFIASATSDVSDGTLYHFLDGATREPLRLVPLYRENDAAKRLRGVEELLTQLPDQALAYMKAVIASCTAHLATSPFQMGGSSLRQFGRVHKTGHPNEFTEPTREERIAAATMTWDQLSRAPLRRRLLTIPDGDMSTVQKHVDECVALSEVAFPDEVDRLLFDSIVSTDSVSRLERIADRLRRSLIDVIEQTPTFQQLLQHPDNVIANINATRVRIAGAPRGALGTWTLPELTEFELKQYTETSSSGFPLLALANTRRVFEDRLRVLRQPVSSICDIPAIYDSLTANAYIYSGTDCAHVLLGVMHYPFYSARFDDASLASRIGYIIAHEMAHQSLVTPWDNARVASLLSNFSSNHYSEALADVLAMKAVSASGLVTPSSDVCRHVSSLWCARVPVYWTPSASGVHPPPNQRGDFACDALQRL